MYKKRDKEQNPSFVHIFRLRSGRCLFSPCFSWKTLDFAFVFFFLGFKFGAALYGLRFEALGYLIVFLPLMFTCSSPLYLCFLLPVLLLCTLLRIPLR